MNDDNRHDDMFSEQGSQVNNEEVNFILKDSPDYHYPSREYSYSNDNNRKRGLFSYSLVAMLGALIGGLISVYIAPALPYQDSDFKTRYEGNSDITQEIKINPTEDIGIVEAVAKKSMRSNVDITNMPPAELGDSDKLKVGEVLLKIDNKEVNSMNELRNLLLNYKPGEAVKLAILRNGSESILDITFIERPDNQ